MGGKKEVVAPLPVPTAFKAPVRLTTLGGVPEASHRTLRPSSHLTPQGATCTSLVGVKRCASPTKRSSRSSPSPPNTVSKAADKTSQHLSTTPRTSSGTERSREVCKAFGNKTVHVASTGGPKFRKGGRKNALMGQSTAVPSRLAGRCFTSSSISKQAGGKEASAQRVACGQGVARIQGAKESNSAATRIASRELMGGNAREESALCGSAFSTAIAQQGTVASERSRGSATLSKKRKRSIHPAGHREMQCDPEIKAKDTRGNQVLEPYVSASQRKKKRKRAVPMIETRLRNVRKVLESEDDYEQPVRDCVEDIDREEKIQGVQPCRQSERSNLNKCQKSTASRGMFGDLGPSSRPKNSLNKSASKLTYCRNALTGESERPSKEELLFADDSEDDNSENHRISSRGSYSSADDHFFVSDDEYYGGISDGSTASCSDGSDGRFSRFIDHEAEEIEDFNNLHRNSSNSSDDDGFSDNDSGSGGGDRGSDGSGESPDLEEATALGLEEDVAIIKGGSFIYDSDGIVPDLEIETDEILGMPEFGSIRKVYSKRTSLLTSIVTSLEKRVHRGSSLHHQEGGSPSANASTDANLLTFDSQRATVTYTLSITIESPTRSETPTSDAVKLEPPPASPDDQVNRINASTGPLPPPSSPSVPLNDKVHGDPSVEMIALNQGVFSDCAYSSQRDLLKGIMSNSNNKSNTNTVESSDTPGADKRDVDKRPIQARSSSPAQMEVSVRLASQTTNTQRSVGLSAAEGRRKGEFSMSSKSLQRNKVPEIDSDGTQRTAVAHSAVAELAEAVKTLSVNLKSDEALKDPGSCHPRTARKDDTSISKMGLKSPLRKNVIHDADQEGQGSSKKTLKHSTKRGRQNNKARVSACRK